VSNFADHFSSKARAYQHARPSYPAALFAHLARACSSHRLAWDCACGSGQASVGLLDYFEKIVATDGSAAQIQAAIQHPKIEYHVATAQRSPLAAASVDVIVVAQALHWFANDDFYNEVRRVASPQAVLAVWGYGRWLIHETALNELFQQFYDEIIAAYWPTERAIVESGYRHLAVPFQECEAPAMRMTATWTLSQMFAYMNTWSACTRYHAAQGTDPLVDLYRRCEPLCIDPTARFEVVWPLATRWFRM